MDYSIVIFCCYLWINVFRVLAPPGNRTPEIHPVAYSLCWHVLLLAVVIAAAVVDLII
jgi:hypothetical protein